MGGSERHFKSLSCDLCSSSLVHANSARLGSDTRLKPSKSRTGSFPIELGSQTCQLFKQCVNGNSQGARAQAAFMPGIQLGGACSYY
jgi:hypothetical protein